MPKFEVFRKRMVPLVKNPYVTVMTRGTMSMNKAAFEALGSPKAIELLYDPEERIIGFHGVDPSEEHAYAIRSGGGKYDTNYIVSGTALVKYYGIPTPVSRRYAAYLEGETLCVDLKAEGTEVTSNRSQKNGHGADQASLIAQSAKGGEDLTEPENS